MESVSVTREYEASADAVRRMVRNPDAFFRGVGFDVDRCGDDVLALAKRVAIKRVELRIRLVDDDATLAYEQLDGPFEEMRARYRVAATDDGCRVTAETEFEPPSSGFGTFVNEHVVERQRRGELDNLATLVEEPSRAADGSKPDGDAEATPDARFDE